MVGLGKMLAASFAMTALGVVAALGPWPAVASAGAELAGQPSDATVDCERGDDLGQAISASVAGAVIAVRGRCVGTYTIDTRLQLRGIGAAARLDGASQGTTLTIGRQGDVVISNIAITGGTGTRDGAAGWIGGGVVNHGRATLRQLTVRDNVVGSAVAGGVGQGAGVWNDGALRLEAVTVESNRAQAFDNEGGGLWNSGVVALDRSAIVGNVAQGYSTSGGGVFNSGTLDSHLGRIEGNVASGRLSAGGGLLNQGRAALAGTDVLGNEDNGASATGGGIANRGALSLSGLEVRANRAVGGDSAVGGGLFNSGTLVLDAVEVIGNEATSGRDNAGGGGVADRRSDAVGVGGLSVHDNLPDDCAPAALCFAA